MKINLGDKVKDKVTGFTGIVVCKHSYLNGCDRCTVQPPINKEKEMPLEESFDEPQLEVLKKSVIKVGNQDTGGPERHTPKSKTLGSKR